MKWYWLVAKQMVEMIARLHDQEVVHGNLRLEKFLVTDTKCYHHDDKPSKPLRPAKKLNVQLVDKDGLPRKDLASAKHSQLQYLTKLRDGNVGPALPFHFLLGSERPKVKLVGFGRNLPRWDIKGFEEETQGQAPEAEFEQRIGKEADVWSLGRVV